MAETGIIFPPPPSASGGGAKTWPNIMLGKKYDSKGTKKGENANFSPIGDIFSLIGLKTDRMAKNQGLNEVKWENI